jgi:hypothetical protein
MTPSPEPDDSDIFARLAQIEYRLARLESIQARQPLVPGGYVNEIGEQFKTQIDDLLGTRDEYAENRFNTRREARQEEEAESKARQEEEAESKARQDKAAEDKARQDETMRKLDLILELIEKIDWTKYRKTQLEQDNSDD